MKQEIKNQSNFIRTNRIFEELVIFSLKKTVFEKQIDLGEIGAVFNDT